MTTNTDTPNTRLALLSKVVAAKVAYWDAFRELEQECTGGGDFTDAHNDEVLGFVESLAVGFDSPADVVNELDDESVRDLNQILGQN